MHCEICLSEHDATDVCDTWTIFADATGSCKKEEFPDMLHPNKAGYAKWKTALADVFCRHARRRVAARFDELFDNEDAATYRVARQALAGELTWLEKGVVGLDVYEREPSVEPALLACENAVLLPHLGSGTGRRCCGPT